MKRLLLILFLIVSVALLAPTPSAQFTSGFRDFLRADQDDTTSGVLTVGGLRSDGDVWINYDGPESDGAFYFYENGSPTGAYLKWDDTQGRFMLSHHITADGFISNNNVTVGGVVYVHYGGPEGDGYLYFYEGGSMTGAHLMWDDDPGTFAFNQPLSVTGDITVTGTVDAVDVAATAALFDTNYAQITLATVLGAVDLGGQERGSVESGL